jgi:hypothetical protein
VAVTGLSLSYSRSMKVGRQHDFMLENQSYCLSLDETLLKEYIRCYGEEHTKAEIQSAIEMGVNVSIACQEFVDGDWDKRVKRIAPVMLPQIAPLRPVSPINDTNPQPQLVPNQPNLPPPSFDLIGAMSKAPENILIIAPSESGKGIVIGNLIAAFKASSDCSVTAIDPKGADTEGGFFAQCDQVHRFKSQLLGRDEIISETKRGWKMFEDECIKWAGIKPCFILIDEMLVIGGCFKKANDTFLQDKIASLVSMGRSQRQFCWIATQYPQLDKLGIDGGIAGQMELLMIVRQKNINLVKGWAKYDLTKLIKFDDAVSCCDDSPVNRAVCWRNDWYPMPSMQNHSGFDRELNQWIGGNENKPADSTVADCGNSPATTPQAAHSDSVADTVATCGDDVADVADTVAGDVLAFFNSVNTATPRTIRDIRMGRRIRKSGATAEDVQSAIDTLVMDGKLSLMNGGYVLPNWTTEDLN